MRYRRCPFCNIRADRKRVERHGQSPEARLDAPMMASDSDSVNFSDELTYDTVECVQFIPCGHEFPLSKVDELDSVLDRLRRRENELSSKPPDVTDPETKMILAEISDLQKRLRKVRWEVSESVIHDGEPIETNRKAFSGLYGTTIYRGGVDGSIEGFDSL